MTLLYRCFVDGAYQESISDDDRSSGSEIAMFGVEIVPEDRDVLLGRGATYQLHPGNMCYNCKA
jgi:hypothetical protein